MLRNYKVSANGIWSLHSKEKQVLTTKMKNKAYTNCYVFLQHTER